jgi:hypothetical protein
MLGVINLTDYATLHAQAVSLVNSVGQHPPGLLSDLALFL